MTPPSAVNAWSLQAFTALGGVTVGAASAIHSAEHLIVHNNTVVNLTIIKDCVRGTLLKLTTNGHKATRGLSATAELLVLLVTYATDLSLCTIKCSSVVAGITLRLLVIHQ